jgi:ketosteroid isomerase-like protein
MGNLEEVKDIYAAFGRGDIPAVTARFALDIDWDWYGPESIPFAGTYKGRDGATELFQRLAANCEFHSFEPRDFYADGNAVVVQGWMDVTARPTGQRWDNYWIHLWTFKDGLVARLREYHDTAAVAAAFAANSATAP